MEIVFLYLQLIGVIFGINLLIYLENPTLKEWCKVLFLSLLPSILYINLKIVGIE